MPITGRVEDDMSVLTVTGTMLVDDVIAFVADWFPRHPTPLALWDLTRASLHAFEWNDFERLAEAGALYVDMRGGSPSTAVVVADEVDERLMRAYHSRLELISPVKQDVFRSVEDARDWLRAA